MLFHPSPVTVPLFFVSDISLGEYNQYKRHSTHRVSYNRFIVQRYNVTNNILTFDRILNAGVSRVTCSVYFIVRNTMKAQGPKFLRGGEGSGLAFAMLTKGN